MLSRAVILFLFASNVWSAGVTIELDTAISIGSFEYTDTDTDEVPELSPIIVAPPIRLPVAMPLNYSDTSEEGVVSKKPQEVKFQGFGQPRFTTLNDGNLYAFNNESGRLKAYTFDYAGVVERFEYPELDNPINTYALQKATLDFNGHYPMQTRAWPRVIETQSETAFHWSEDLYEISSRNVGEWNALQGEGDGVPSGFSDYLQVSAHPEYEREGDVTGFIYSYDNGRESGLWLQGIQFGVEGFAFVNEQVSQITIEQSKLLQTHKGLAQFYIEAAGPANLRFIEEVNEPVVRLEVDNTFYNAHSIYNSEGTLYQFVFEHGGSLVWHDKASDLRNAVQFPVDVDYLNFCNETNDRFFCVMKSQNAYALYELIDGEFVHDRDMTHELLGDGLVGIDGIYAYGDNRFVAIKTLDLKNNVFNFTPDGGHLTHRAGRSGSVLTTQIIESDMAGTFFYVISSKGAAFTQKIVASLPVDPEPESPVEEVTPPDSRESGQDEKDSNEEEEDKEIPYAEMEGSLNIYLLMLALLILMPLRFAKK